MMFASAIALAFSGTSNAATLNWDGGGGVDNEFSTAANWADSVTGLDAVPANVDTLNILNGSTVSRTVNSAGGRTNIQGGSILNVSAGTHSDGTAGNTVRNFVGNGSAGTLNVSGGSYDIGHLLAISHSTNSDGSVNVTGGLLNIGRGSNSLVGGFGGNFALGHSISIGSNSGQNNVTGQFTISGGALKTRTGIAVAHNGTFSQIGSAITEISLGGAAADAGWFAMAGSTSLWNATIDGGGITKMFVEAQTNTSTLNPFVTILAGSTLNLGFTGSAMSGTWTLLELEGQDIDDQGLVLSAATLADPNWSFNVDNSGANGLLTVTYVPEPSSIALLAAGGLLALRRRR